MKNKSNERISYEGVQTQFNNFKEKAGNPKYIACFGKTFVDVESEDYMLSEKIGETIVDCGFGVLHGGYIGTMDAVSKGAQTAIAKDATKNNYWNIGVPMKLFEENVARTNAMHLAVTDNIFDRKRALVEMGDACVVLPVGGVGTFLEVIEVFHLNQLNLKFGGKIRPIIFFGSRWQKLMETIYTELDLTGQSDGSSFTTNVLTIDALKDTLTNIIK